MHTNQLVYSIAKGVIADEMVRKVITLDGRVIVVDKRGNVFEITIAECEGSSLLKDEELH